MREENNTHINQTINDLAAQITETLVNSNLYSLEDIYAGVNVLEILLVLYETKDPEDFDIFVSNKTYYQLIQLLGKDNVYYNKLFTMENALAKTLSTNKQCLVILEINNLQDTYLYQTLLDIQRYQPKLVILIIDEQHSLLRHHSSVDGIVNSIRISRSYTTVKKDMKRILQGNLVGEPVLNSLRNVRNALKSNVIESTLFSELGFNYVGPINGHNHKEIRKVFSLINDPQEPQVLHFQTRVRNKWLKDYPIPTYKTDNELPINYYDFNLILKRKIIPLISKTSINVLVSNEFSKRYSILDTLDNTSIHHGSLPTLLAIANLNTHNILFIHPNDSRNLMSLLSSFSNINLTIISSQIGYNKNIEHIYDLVGSRDINNLNIYQGKSLFESYLLLEQLIENDGINMVRFENVKEELVNTITPQKDAIWIFPEQGMGTIITYGSHTNKVETRIINNELKYGLLQINKLNLDDNEILNAIKQIDKIYVLELDSIVSIVHLHLKNKGIKSISYSLSTGVTTINEFFEALNKGDL